MSENFRSNVCEKYALQGSFRAVCILLFLYSFEYVSLFKLSGKEKFRKKSSANFEAFRYSGAPRARVGGAP